MPKTIARVLLIIAICSGFLEYEVARGDSPPPDQPPTEGTTTENQKIYLPVIQRDGPPPVFGAEVFSFAEWKLDRAREANLYWIRNRTFSWAEIEPEPTNPRTYRWDGIDEEGLAELSSRRLTLIGTIKYAPAWAQKIPGKLCGPIAKSSLDEYGQFINALVSRYSVYPYNIHYWEFGNEPDIEPSIVPDDNDFGCWGDPNDPYYGGRYYAEMLKIAYPAVKAADPKSQVMIGGLLLDCDPAHPPPGNTSGCLPAKFFEGILKNQGANYFDVVSFHTYVGYGDGRIGDVDNPSWIYRGGQIDGKISFLRSVMKTYGIEKPIFMSEVSLSCIGDNCSPPSDHFMDLQADFVVSSYIRSWGYGLLGSIWYSLEDPAWRAVGLFYGSTPKPAYEALVYLTSTLQTATIGPEITQYPGLRGYQFQLTKKKIWVMWAPDGATGVSIPLPAGVTRVVDKYGNPISPAPDPITITHATYFEFSQ